MARLAREHRLHYANLTEYVQATNEITELARGAEQGFLLQTGLAPGVINVLANGLFQRFCREHGVDKVDDPEMRVGALTRTTRAAPPLRLHLEPHGRGHRVRRARRGRPRLRKTTRPSLSDRRVVLDRRRPLRGGAHLRRRRGPPGPASRARCATSTTRPSATPATTTGSAASSTEMRSAGVPEKELPAASSSACWRWSPSWRDDLVVIYAAVEGRDREAALHRHGELAGRPPPQGRRPPPQGDPDHHLRRPRRIGPAPPRDRPRGVYFQSQIDPERFMDGPFVSTIYG